MSSSSTRHAVQDLLHHVAALYGILYAQHQMARVEGVGGMAESLLSPIVALHVKRSQEALARLERAVEAVAQTSREKEGQA